MWTLPCWGICGAAISPNSQYLYITTGLQLLQYDLWAKDIQSSKLVAGEYDGYVEPGWFGTYFGMMALAPDGRIYMLPTTGSSRVMHVIDKPNERGEACNLLQHNIQLPTSNARTLPNFPNYSLGSLPEGACDTTTIDSTMIADFTFTINTHINPFKVQFTDLSYYDPVSWSWNFGDGHTSTEQHPVHVYDTSGEYLVCLAVTNAWNADTLCLELTVADTSEPQITALFTYEISDTSLTVSFTDQSHTGPESWHWDFGDDSTSGDQHPVHTYDTAGIYTACLAVSKGAATDTSCQDITLTGTSAVHPGATVQAQPVVSPNPFARYLDFTPPEGREIYAIRIFDTQGRLLLNTEMSCPCRIVMEAFPPGVYLYQVTLRDGTMVSGKAVKG
jgi:PKD repeat protein